MIALNIAMLRGESFSSYAPNKAIKKSSSAKITCKRTSTNLAHSGFTIPSASFSRFSKISPMIVNNDTPIIVTLTASKTDHAWQQTNLLPDWAIVKNSNIASRSVSKRNPIRRCPCSFLSSACSFQYCTVCGTSSLSNGAAVETLTTLAAAVPFASTVLAPHTAAVCEHCNPTSHVAFILLHAPMKFSPSSSHLHLSEVHAA
mmetsp:Transcript_117709/g.214052  ORF Transcript_117709/g.214052 Transcript_117709/m.214052 type:complete len:202 (-) Transcript_117709:279-884(-)